jgi:hypothetical protein
VLFKIILHFFTVTNVIGVGANASGGSEEETITNLIGGDFKTTTAFVIANSIITNIMAGKFQILAYGSGNVNITNAYGILIPSPGFTPGGTKTNLYGLYIENQSGFDNSYNIYSAGGGSKNKFEGNMDIGGNLGVSGAIYVPSASIFLGNAHLTSDGSDTVKVDDTPLATTTYVSNLGTDTERVSADGAGDISITLEYIRNLKYADFQLTSPAPSAREGRVFYDADNHCFTVYNDVSDTSLQVGQETITRVRNQTGSQINNGEVVYVNGSSGQTATVALSQADDHIKVCNLGLATHNIGNNQFGYITVRGLVREVNTAAFSNGDRLYVSPVSAGQLTNVEPTAPYEKAFIGTVITKGNNGSILVNPAHHGSTSELSDIINTTRQDKSILVWTSGGPYYDVDYTIINSSDSISASATDFQLATAKLIHNSNQGGQITLSNSTSGATINLNADVASSDYYPICSIENTDDVNPSFYQIMTVNKTSSSFDIILDGNVDSGNYKVNWKITFAGSLSSSSSSSSVSSSSSSSSSSLSSSSSSVSSSSYSSSSSSLSSSSSSTIPPEAPWTLTGSVSGYDGTSQSNGTALTSLNDGNFMLGYQYGSDGTGSATDPFVVKVFDPNGNEVLSQTEIIAANVLAPEMTTLNNGNVVVVWEELLANVGRYGIWSPSATSIKGTTTFDPNNLFFQTCCTNLDDGGFFIARVRSDTTGHLSYFDESGNEQWNVSLTASIGNIQRICLSPLTTSYGAVSGGCLFYFRTTAQDFGYGLANSDGVYYTNSNINSGSGGSDVQVGYGTQLKNGNILFHWYDSVLATKNWITIRDSSGGEVLAPSGQSSPYGNGYQRGLITLTNGDVALLRDDNGSFTNYYLYIYDSSGSFIERVDTGWEVGGATSVEFSRSVRQLTGGKIVCLLNDLDPQRAVVTFFEGT